MNSSFTHIDITPDKEYPFISCLDPQYVYNKYNGQLLETSCNKCVACFLSKGTFWTNLCNIQEQDSRFTMFVTLTYSNITIPTCTPFVFDAGTFDQRVYFKVNEMDRWNSEYISEEGWLLDDLKIGPLHFEKFDDDLDYLAKFVDKFNMNGDIPLMCKYDAQKFFKRFRYFMSKFDIHEKIKYYCVFEIGAVHFRPHIHALIYFDSRSLLYRFKEILCKAWKFGRVDFSLSRGGASSYCAKYLNSSNLVPEFFKAKVTKAVSLHSTHFAVGFYEDKKEEIYAYDPRRIITHIRQIGTRDECISLWRNLTSIFFPKCRGLNRFDYYTVFRLFTCYPMAVKLYKESSLTKLVDILSASRVNYFEPLIFDFLGNTRSLRKYDQIYHDLYISKHFFEFCCNGDWSNSCIAIRRILDFYKYYGLKRLADFYYQQESHPEIDYRYFYDDFRVDFPRSRLIQFKQFRSDVAVRASVSIKHKKQNDKNRMFIDYE